MPRLFVLVVLVALASCAHVETPPSFIGSIVPPYPQSLKEQAGACVGSGDALHACNYAVDVLANTNDQPMWVIAGRFQDRNELGKPHWLVTDALSYPHTSKSRVLLFATCLYKNVPDGSVLAIVTRPAAQAKRATNWAYKVDFATGKFVKLASADVACYQPEGDD